MNTLNTTDSESRMNPASSLEYLATLISQQMTPPSGFRALPKEQVDPPLTNSDIDEAALGQTLEASIDAIPTSPTPNSTMIFSPTPTHSEIAEIPLSSQVNSCPFDDYVLWGALVTSTPHVVCKTSAMPKDCPKSPSLSDSDISEIQVIPRRLDARSISSSPTTTSQDSDSFSVYSSASPSSPMVKNMDIAREYDFLADWLTELSITAPATDTQMQPASSADGSVLAELDLQDSPMNEDHPSNIFDDAHEASPSKHDVTMEAAEPIQQALAPKVSYSLLRHFEELDSSFNMTPPKLSTNNAASPTSSLDSPSLKKVLSNTSTRTSEKHITTPKMLKFKRDLSRKTRKAKKGLLDFSWKVKNRFQEQYNVNFKTNGTAKAVNGMRLAGCRGDFGCIVNDGPFGFNPPVMDWSFEVPAGYPSTPGLPFNAGAISALKTSRSSAFPSLKSIPDITDLNAKLKAVQCVSDPTAECAQAVPTTPSLHTMSSWSFSADEEGCQSPTCAGSEPNPGIVDTNHVDDRTASLTGESSDLAQTATFIVKKDDESNSVGLSSSIIVADTQLSPAPSSCPRCFSIHPQISDTVSTSACCNFPALAMSPVKTTDTVPHAFDLKLAFDLELLELDLEHDTTSTLHDGGANSLCTGGGGESFKGKGKGKQKVLALDCNNSSEVTDYLGLRTFTSTLGSLGSGGHASTVTSPNPMVYESNVRLPGAYVFDDGELDASRSFSAALSRAYKLLFDQATTVDV